MMLKRVILAAVATAFVAAAAIPVAMTPADAATTCKQAAKAKFAGDRKARHAFKKECKAAWKAQQKA
jgi:catabolite regulation protein CreA